MFIDAYLALCTVIATGSVTEAIASGYARQPISFSIPHNGVAAAACAWDFGYIAPGQLAGRAVYDAPIGGNLLLVLPFSTSRVAQGGPTDSGEEGDIALTITAMQAFASGAAFSGTFAANTVIGVVHDRAEEIGSVVSGGGYKLVANSSPLSTGVGLTITRGVLAAAPH